MLSNLHKDHKELVDSDIFKKEKGFLTSCFAMSDSKEIKNQDWQFDFYHKEEDTITSYKNKEIINSNSEIHKEKNKTIPKLEISKVKMEFEEALKVAEKEVKIGNAKKTIAVIQTIGKPLFNFTFLTNAMKMINVKINAETKEVISSEEHNLLDLNTN